MRELQILKLANELVKEYIIDGWLISWGTSSCRYHFMVELIKGDTKRRVYIDRSFDRKLCWIEFYMLKVVDMDKTENFETGQNYLVSRTFYEIGKDWYTEDFEEIKKVCEKKLERYKRSITTKKPITPRAEFIDKIKKYRGFARASIKNITITRNYEGYTITGYSNKQLTYHLIGGRA